MASPTTEDFNTAIRYVTWSDRWLGCSLDEDNNFVRNWVSLTDTLLRVTFHRDDDPESQSLVTLNLRDLSIEANPNRFTIAVYDDSRDVLFRCGEALEYRATLDALQRRVELAKANCPSCAELQRALESLVAELAEARSAGTSAEEQRKAKEEAERIRMELEAQLDAAHKEAESTKALLESAERRRAVAEARVVTAEDAERKAVNEVAAANAESAAAKRQLVADLAAAKDSSAAFEARVQQLDAETRASGERESRLRAQLSDLEARVDHAGDELRSRDSEISALRARVRALEEENSSAQDELGRLRDGAGNLKDDVAALRRDNAELRAQADEAAIASSSTTAQLAAEAKRRKVLEARCEAEVARVTALEAQQAETARKSAQLADHKRALEADLERVRADLNSERERSVRASDAVAAKHGKEVEALSQSIADLEAVVQANSVERASREVVLASQTQELSELRGDLDAARRALSDAEKERDSLRAAEAQRHARVFVDAPVQVEDQRVETASRSACTDNFADVIARAPEFAQVGARHAAVAVADLITDTCASLDTVLSPAALSECEPLLALLRSSLATSAAAANLEHVLECGSPGEAGDLSPASRRQRRAPAATREERALARAALGLDEASHHAAKLLAEADSPDSPLSRGYVVANAAGYLESLRKFNAAASSIGTNNEFRDAVMSYLKGPGNTARAAATDLAAPHNRAYCNATLLKLCRQLEVDFCELFDQVLRCAGGRVVNDANWRRNVTRAISECTTLAHTFAKAGAPQKSADGGEGAIDEALKRAGAVAETVRSLLASDSCTQHQGSTRELVVAHANLQMAVFLAARRSNRALMHHDAAESIARFGVALKRAGQILEQARIPGSQQYAAECLAGWPIVKQLTELPRRFAEEDRAFGLLWESLIETSRGTLVVPAVEP